MPVCTTQSKLQTSYDWNQTIYDIVHRTEINSPKMYMEPEKPRMPKAILCTKWKLSDFVPYYQATVSKAAWCWHKNSHMDWGNMTKSLEIDSHTYGQLIFDKGGKKTYNGEKTGPSATSIVEAGQLHVNQGSWNTPSYNTQNKLKMLCRLKTPRHDTTGLLEENMKQHILCHKS